MIGFREPINAYDIPKAMSISICRRGHITGVSAMSLPASRKQTLPLVQLDVQNKYFIKTKFLGEFSIEKCVAFGTYLMYG